jgi:predicted nucleic acid-binding protein
VHFLRGREPGLTAVRSATASIATTAVTVLELFQGVRTEKERTAVKNLTDRLTVLPLDRSAAARAGGIRAALRASGKTIELADAAIAAICLEHRATLVTGNVKHFERIDGLSLQPLTS